MHEKRLGKCQHHLYEIFPYLPTTVLLADFLFIFFLNLRLIVIIHNSKTDLFVEVSSGFCQSFRSFTCNQASNDFYSAYKTCVFFFCEWQVN